ITPIARKRGSKYELDLILRNNITSKDHPLGVFHPHADLHHIKKENIGLIEAMGLAVLPSRLEKDMGVLRDVLLNHTQRGEDLRPTLNNHPEFGDHTNWIVDFTKKYKKITEKNVDSIIEAEIGGVFVRVLEDSGVFKCDKTGREHFMRFVETLAP
ncbi:MAG: galactose-1-phosphate uridylyltransferase, partial [Lachnospiraceae bacterium]|nr:galactose-1-phosphate uridylyltransferase [Lachnospiraceae bacterium]